MSRKLQVGDWVRDSVGGFAYEVKTDIYVTHWESRIRSGHAVRVYVRDVKTRKVKASELWAWLHKEGYVLAPWSTEDVQATWGITLYGATTSIATGPTPLRAIVNARKALKKVKP